MRLVSTITCLAPIVLLIGCFGGDLEAPGEPAERNISRDLQQLFDGIDVAPAANCVRDQATEAEVAILSQDNIATAPLTRQIFERPATLACLQANGVIEVIDIVEVVQ